MKIKELWVSKYKNIENIDLTFHSDLVTLLIGRNGLGKSNLIEILALIFRDLDLINKQEDLESWAYYDDRGQFEFRIRYECYEHDIQITVKKDLFKFELFNSESIGIEKSFSEWKASKSEKYLPKYIIGYYSGENKRISKIIEPHSIIEKKLQRNWHRRKTLPERSLRRLFFTENKHSQLVLITLAIYRNNVVFGKLIEELFRDYLKIDQITKFDIKFNNPRSRYYKKIGASADYFEENYTNLKSEVKKSKVEFPFWNLKGKVNKLIGILFNHHLENASYITYENEGDDKRRFVKEFLQLKDTKIEEIFEEIYEEFEHPMDFFDALESTFNLEILSEISVTVKLNDLDHLINFTQLSEGQQQIMTVIGTLLITGRDECLFLFDEPDTHVNPRWQRDYVQLIRDFNLNGTKSHVIIATHSPLIVQSSENADVFLFKKLENKIIIDTAPHQIHNWRIDQVLQSEYFEFENTRPSHLDEFMKKREEILSKIEITKEDMKYLRELDKKMGQLPSGETLNDFQTIHLFHQIVAQNKIDE